MRILIWHVHGSWMTNFVQGGHTYLVPRVLGRGPDGRGRAQTWDWPVNVVEVTPDEVADTDVDVVIVQGLRELELAEKWLAGRRPGRDVPLVWLEHNAPPGAVGDMRHPAADLRGTIVVHVTRTNALFWDVGRTPSVVIPHGIIDPGALWTGEVLAAAVVVNEPLRRGRVVGTDLLRTFSAGAPIDLFGMQTDAVAAIDGHPVWLRTFGNLTQDELHRAMAARRCYLHPVRWTSLGLSLVEAMHLGMPVVALATTEVPDAVPPSCGIVSNDLDRLVRGLKRLLSDTDLAAELGGAARQHALEHFGLARFLTDWDRLLASF
jgi:hypothetical protein